MRKWEWIRMRNVIWRKKVRKKERKIYRNKEKSEMILIITKHRWKFCLHSALFMFSDFRLSRRFLNSPFRWSIFAIIWRIMRANDNLIVVIRTDNSSVILWCEWHTVYLFTKIRPAHVYHNSTVWRTRQTTTFFFSSTDWPLHIKSEY